MQAAAAGVQALDVLLFLDQQRMPACLEVALAALQRRAVLDNAVVGALAARLPAAVPEPAHECSARHQSPAHQCDS